MRFEYCPHCGTRAVQKEIGDEGLMPWCDRCKRPLFDIFSTCIIALAVDEEGNVALLRQGYISTRHYVLVSGYIKPGESAEECAAREIGEELGLAVRGLHFTGTYWLGKKDMLMIGFVANVHREEFHLSQEGGPGGLGHSRGGPDYGKRPSGHFPPGGGILRGPSGEPDALCFGLVHINRKEENFHEVSRIIWEGAHGFLL